MENLNIVETRILDYLDMGENKTDLIQIARDLKLSRPTVSKYIKRLQEKQLILKVTKGYSGGSTHDRKLITIITKL